MKVNITYHDSDALTVEEVVLTAQHNYGKYANVVVTPESSKPHDLIYFAIQCIITHKQLGILYNDKLGYQKSLQTLRNETLGKLEEILSQVIIDNEARVS